MSLVALLLIVFCSIAVLHFETDPESNIKTAEDALWWAFATITTVGYGDCYPVTWEGRLIATILMCAGVGLFGTFSAFLAAWFIGSEPGKGSLQVSADLRELREEVAALRRTLEERAGNAAAHQRDGTDRGVDGFGERELGSATLARLTATSEMWSDAAGRFFQIRTDRLENPSYRTFVTPGMDTGYLPSASGRIGGAASHS